jgi:hypothetical protein
VECTSLPSPHPIFCTVWDILPPARGGTLWRLSSSILNEDSDWWCCSFQETDTQQIAICPQVSRPMHCAQWGVDEFMGGTTVFSYFRTSRDWVSLQLTGLIFHEQWWKYALRFQVHTGSIRVPLQSASTTRLSGHVVLMGAYCWCSVPLSRMPYFFICSRCSYLTGNTRISLHGVLRG